MKMMLQATYRTRAQSLLGIDALATALGRDLTPMLTRCGLSPSLMTDPDSDIDYSAMCRLLEECANEWRCPDLGLRLATTQNLNFLGVVGLAAMQAKTVEGALQALRDHMAIHSTGFHTEVEELMLPSGRQATLSFVPKPGVGAGRQVAEHSIYVARNILAVLSGMQAFKPIRVDFQHTPLPDETAVRHFFCCPVAYNAPANAIHFDAQILRAPNAVRDTAYAPLIDAYFAKVRPSLDADVINAVRNMIGKLLASGECSLAAVAQAYRVHPRTLQRRLRERGFSFGELLDDYRQALATDLVRRGAIPLVKIADALGYADQSTFNQAFRRWTGTTPTLFSA
jgi:AraC-like DNA-binding protein